MKLLGISCGRRGGNSETLLKAALKTARDEAGAQVEFLRLQDHKINLCTGCELCSNWDNWPGGVFPESGYLCHYKKGSDHLVYIIEKIRAADALVLSTPIYNLTVPGSLLALLNRIHCVGFAKHMDVAAREKTLCATIAVGGSDMTNLTRPMLNFTAVELCGSQMNLVDQMLVQFCAPLKYIALRDEAVERAKALGRNVAASVRELEATGRVVYHGTEDNPELCPVCHGDLLQRSGDRVRCPVCNIEGDVEQTAAGVRVKWDGGLDKCRLNHNEHEETVMARQRAPYAVVRERKEEAQEKLKAIGGDLTPLAVPPLTE